ncbi:hypothetical protein JD969_01905 [Planctomycetota bacterium]|nr:hypothetical protein JD969_01905 [Planctomycetota bacterium]
MNDEHQSIEKFKEAYQSIRYEGDLMADIEERLNKRDDAKPIKFMQYVRWGGIAAMITVGVLVFDAVFNSRAEGPTAQPVDGTTMTANQGKSYTKIRTGVIDLPWYQGSNIEKKENQSRPIYMSLNSGTRKEKIERKGRVKLLSLGGRKPLRKTLLSTSTRKTSNNKPAEKESLL